MTNQDASPWKAEFLRKLSAYLRDRGFTVGADLQGSAFHTAKTFYAEKALHLAANTILGTHTYMNMDKGRGRDHQAVANALSPFLDDSDLVGFRLFQGCPTLVTVVFADNSLPKEVETRLDRYLEYSEPICALGIRVQGNASGVVLPLFVYQNHAAYREHISVLRQKSWRMTKRRIHFAWNEWNGLRVLPAFFNASAGALEYADIPAYIGLSVSINDAFHTGALRHLFQAEELNRIVAGICSRCEGTAADTTLATICPQCGSVCKESILRVCGHCRYDFLARAAGGTAWAPESEVPVAAVPAVEVAAGAAGTDAAVEAASPGWYRDPSGRHQFRWFDGDWSSWAADEGEILDDPLT